MTVEFVEVLLRFLLALAMSPGARALSKPKGGSAGSPEVGSP